MFFKSKRLEERAGALELLTTLFKEKSNVLIIHYSCESFITTHGRTPRITSIGIRNFDTGQTYSFSIHLQAQIQHLDFRNLTIEQYDRLEKLMLEEYFTYVKKHNKARWVHWNMRDTNYGFEAIANRFKILGGKTKAIIDSENRYDLPRILGKLYTHEYETHQPTGKLLNLCKRNGITILDALSGQLEAKAFEDHEYLALHKSTLRKVDMISSILERVGRGELKVGASTSKIYGLSFPGIFEMVRNNWLLFIIWSIIVYIIGAATEPLVQKWFGTSQ